MLTALLLLAFGRVDAHDPALLDPNRATAGIRLSLVEVASPPTSRSPAYRLEVNGAPRGVTFSVWTKEFGHSFHEVTGGFRMDDTGKLASVAQRDASPRYLEEMAFEPGPYFRGASWEVALASEDRTISAFTKVIPQPMVARDGGCLLSLELVSHRGDRFLASGSGFVPGEIAVIESRYAGRISKKRRPASREGRLPPDVIAHATSDADRRARYSVKAQSCEVALDYQWGEEAFRRQPGRD